jgi:arylsulfatase A-like enzyme
MPRRPNIVLCICDQLRPFEVGCYGSPVVRTPAIDRLAREGVRFETAVTNYPVCMAARSVLMSGQYNRTCTGGVSNVNVPTWPGDCCMPEYPVRGRPHLRDTTLPEALREAGYRTAIIGKWHIHAWPDDVGFDSYLIPRVHHCYTGQSFTRDGGPEFAPDGFSVDFEAAEVETFLRRASQDNRPFFLYYSISPPHCPLADAPEDVLRLYSPAAIPLRPNVDPAKPLPNEDYWLRVYRYDFRHYSLRLPYADQLPDGYGLRQLIAEYCGLTTWMDSAVGRMLTALDAAGLSEDTIVLFTSDHGDNLGSHGLVQKGTPNDESIRIPLVVRWPGRIPAGRVCTRQVASLVDLAPSLLSLAGCEVPDAMQGMNLAPVMDGTADRSARPYAVVEMGHGTAVRSADGMVFARFLDGGRALADTPEQVFEDAADPYQLANLAAGPLPSWASEACERLADWDRATPWMTE